MATTITIFEKKWNGLGFRVWKWMVSMALIQNEEVIVSQVMNVLLFIVCGLLLN